MKKLGGNMKLRSYYREGMLRIGIEEDSGLFELKDFDVMTDLIVSMQEIQPSEHKAFMKTLKKEAVDVALIRPAAPIVDPVKDVICVGLNYQDHVNESQSMAPNEDKSQIHTTYFGKRCDYIRGDGEEVTIHAALDSEMDYETELVVIIGRGGRGISRNDAYDYVFGYSIGNDFSSRTLQRNHKQWLLGKGLDGYTAMGPCILLNEKNGAQDFDLRGYVNGELRQSSNTKMMIKSVSDIIHEISQGITLVPGDIIFTGTPAGVGAGFIPKRFLQAGDLVELKVEDIGSLTNRVISG